MYETIIFWALMGDPQVWVTIENMNIKNFGLQMESREKLEKMGYRAIPALTITRNNHQDENIRKRADWLIGIYQMNMKPRNYPKMPYIDMLPPEFTKESYSNILWRYRQLVDGQSDSQNDWATYRGVTHCYIVDLVEGRVEGMRKYSYEEVYDLLDQMVVRERAWRKKTGLDKGP